MGAGSGKSKRMNKREVVFFRQYANEEVYKEEADAIRKHFPIIDDLSSLQEDDVVMPRFSMRPFASAIEEDINNHDASLLNSVKESEWISSIEEWYPFMQDLTPKTVWNVNDVDNNGPFFVKGNINAKRDLWATHCFAKDKEELNNVINNLREDALIQNQDLCIRNYVELNKIGENGDMPLGEEYRVWFYNGMPYFITPYWGDKASYPSNHLPPENFILDVGSRVEVPWAVFDIAFTADGEWIVIEGNNPANSGLCGANPDDYYSAFSNILKNN